MGYSLDSLCNLNSPTRRFKRVAKKAGFCYLRLHDLRYSIASLMLKNVTNPKVVQECLGHKSINRLWIGML
ncbi:tyrosine-type recombinase/integrase [Orenia marismortui]|uniref:tyrosine-type recombinase/integrase n=1 Tax=Orenia marismortui TaxID=46469 RepID=UPI003B848AE0